MVDEDLVEQVFRRLAREENAESQNVSVGYCKPPAETRWVPGQSGNRSGKRKTPVSGCDLFWASVLKRHPVIEAGRKKKLNSAAIICSRIVEQAIKGDPKARREVRNFIIELHKRNLLSPPPPPDTSKQDLVKLIFKSDYYRALYVARYSFTVRSEMKADFDMVYGPDEDFLEKNKRKETEFMAWLSSKQSARSKSIEEAA